MVSICSTVKWHLPDYVFDNFSKIFNSYNFIFEISTTQLNVIWIYLMYAFNQYRLILKNIHRLILQ